MTYRENPDAKCRYQTEGESQITTRNRKQSSPNFGHPLFTRSYYLCIQLAWTNYCRTLTSYWSIYKLSSSIYSFNQSFVQCKQIVRCKSKLIYVELNSSKFGECFSIHHQNISSIHTEYLKLQPELQGLSEAH